MPDRTPRSPFFCRASRALLLACVLLGLIAAPAAASERYAAFVIDAGTNRVLFAENADARRYPASLTKMMTLFMLFEALESGRTTLSTPMKVSAHAASRPPTKLGLKAGSTLTPREAIPALVTRSANDASAVIAEHLGGTVPRFAQMMTKRANALGMKRTVFRNPHGLPDAGQYTTARDMATLGIALRERFPQYYRYFSTRSFDFRGRTISTHNNLLGQVEGVDGIKTGYINASGFNVVTSVVRGDRRLVAVVMGGRTARSRDAHMRDLIARTLPMAGGRSPAPLVASAERAPRVTPSPRPRSIEARIAEAYETGAAVAVRSPAPAPVRRVPASREALRAGLARQAVEVETSLPAASALVAPRPRAAVPQGLVPRAPIPAAGLSVDSVETASLETAPASPFAVQIAAVPARAEAMALLRRAQERVGAPLAGARPVTQAIGQLHRARFTGFQSWEAAGAACAALRRAGVDCFATAGK